MNYSTEDIIKAIIDNASTIQKIKVEQLMPMREAMVMAIGGGDRIIEYTKQTMVENIARVMLEKGIVLFEDKQTPMGRKLSCELLVIDTSLVKKGGEL